MLTIDDQTHVARLREQTEAEIAQVSWRPQDAVLLDAPALLNVGDSMIWAGQLAYMKSMGFNVRYVSDMQNYSAARIREALPHGGTIFLRGGGNFGDVWVGHQNFRERVAQDFPHYVQIVQLTQSVLFRDPARAAQANRILGAHPDFKLLVRDELSLERVKRDLPDIDARLSHDMALGWTPTHQGGAGTKALVIARDDREASSGLLAAAEKWNAPFEVQVTDWTRHAEHPQRWHDARARLQRNGRRMLRRKIAWALPKLDQTTIESELDYLNQWNLDWATNLFAGARAVVVDRLHAHVLASLMGIPHVVLDNDHGKISSVFESYTGQFSTARYTTSTDEAFEILTDLMN